MRKQMEVQCNSCKQMHLKDASEIKRNAKIGRDNYCSRTCVGKSEANIAHLNRVNPLDASHLVASNRRDEFSLYREHLRRANQRGKVVNITLQDLKDTFEAQKGICVYSKVVLIHTKVGICDPIYTASLDRIDSSKGYVKNNIQFISVTMNHMKNSMTHEKMLEALQVLRN